MRRLKQALEKPAVRHFLTWLASAYMRLVYKTTRWEFQNFEAPRAYLERGEGFLTCFWHERLFMMVFGWQFDSPFYMMISAHKDGRLIAETVGHFGVHWIAGSTAHGGSEALRKSLQLLRHGQVVGITPDGPRGPRRRASRGTITLAQRAHVDLLPITFATTRCAFLSSWDRFVLPLPFGRGIIAWGKPVKVADLDTEQARQMLEKELASLTDEIDKACGHRVG